jgi:hypothetical protein
MRFRAYILCLLILSQPLSAFGAAWHSNVGVDTGDSMASHCDAESMPGHHQQPVSDDESDCIDACDSCAACALVANAQITFEQPYVRPVNSLELLLVMPPGKAKALYRPPILS